MTAQPNPPPLFSGNPKVRGLGYHGAPTRPLYWSVWRELWENHSIYIAPEFHRRGLGRALLAALIIECEARSYRQMIAVIGDFAQTASISLHEAAGFRLVGTLQAVGFKFDRWLDSVLMQRPLGPGATTGP